MARVNIQAHLGLDGRGFEAGLLRSQRLVSGFGRRMATTFAGFFTVGILARAAQKTIDWGSATSDLAESIGVTTEELQELEYAARKTGGSVESIVQAFRRMSQFRNEVLATKGSRAGRIAAALGIDPEEMKQLDTPMKLFERFAEIFRTKNFGAAQAGLLQDIFGRGGLSMLKLFVEGMGKLRAEARALGLVEAKDVVNTLDEIKDKQEEISQRLRGPMAEGLQFAYNMILKMLDAIDMFASVIANLDFSGINTGMAYIGAQLRNPEKKSPALIGKFMRDVNIAKDTVTAIFGQLQNVFKKAVDEGGKQWLSGKISDVIEQGAKLREAAGAAFVEAFGGNEPKIPKPAKVAAFRPPTDALARIGGFVGRGNVPAENYEKQQVAELKQLNVVAKRVSGFMTSDF